MWYSTSLTKLLGIEYPLIQAPLAGAAAAPTLVAAVSNAGGLGSLARRSWADWEDKLYFAL